MNNNNMHRHQHFKQIASYFSLDVRWSDIKRVERLSRFNGNGFSGRFNCFGRFNCVGHGQSGITVRSVSVSWVKAVVGSVVSGDDGLPIII